MGESTVQKLSVCHLTHWLHCPTRACTKGVGMMGSLQGEGSRSLVRPPRVLMDGSLRGSGREGGGSTAASQ